MQTSPSSVLVASFSLQRTDTFGAAVQHERAPRGQPRRRNSSLATRSSPPPLYHGGPGQEGLDPRTTTLCCNAATAGYHHHTPLMSRRPLGDLCWTTSREPRENGSTRTTNDSVPSSTTQPEEDPSGGPEEQEPDSAASSTLPLSSSSPDVLGPRCSPRPPPTGTSLLSQIGGLPFGTLPSAGTTLADLQCAGPAAVPLLRGPFTLMPRPLLWWPLSEGECSLAKENFCYLGRLCMLLEAKLRSPQDETSSYSVK